MVCYAPLVTTGLDLPNACHALYNDVVKNKKNRFTNFKTSHEKTFEFEINDTNATIHLPACDVKNTV